MDWISPLRVVDVALAWLLLETAYRLWRKYRPATGSAIEDSPRSQPGRDASSFLPNALSGCMLLLALRSVLAGWETGWFLAFMTLAGLAHLLDAGLLSRHR